MVKVDSYSYPEQDELTAATTTSMALFSLKEVKPAEQGDRWPEGVLQVSHQVTGPPLSVVTVLKCCRSGQTFTWQEQGTELLLGETSEAGQKRLARLNLFALLKTITGFNPGPWGILRGVRPTKIPHKLLARGLSSTQTAELMEKHYGVNQGKARLITQIAGRQRPFLLSAEAVRTKVSIYVGIPFCPSRCLYCSFPSYELPTDGAKVQQFLQVLTQDIQAAADTIARYNLQVQTLYVGGGTPTSLPTEDFQHLLDQLVTAFGGPDLVEFTVEAGRPDSLSDGKIQAMKAAGVTRVSVNPQTMHDNTLKLIGRRHTVQDIIKMLAKIRYSGLGIVNMDIIVGLPGEGPQEMVQTMEQLVGLAPDNLTVHMLALKKGSLLKMNQKEYILPSQSVAAAMQAIAHRGAEKMGLIPYYLYRQKDMTGNLENIGFSKPGAECIYNIQIIEERQTLIGIGPGSATKAVDPRNWRLTSTYHPKDLTTYLNTISVCIQRRQELLARLFEH